MRKISMYSHKLTKDSVLPTISARFPVSYEKSCPRSNAVLLCRSHARANTECSGNWAAVVLRASVFARPLSGSRAYNEDAPPTWTSSMAVWSAIANSRSNDHTLRPNTTRTIACEKDYRTFFLYFFWKFGYYFLYLHRNNQ